MCARHRMFIAIAVCAIGLGRGTLPAEATPSAEPLRVDALVAEALKQTPELEAARQRWRAAQERVPQARALDDPEFKIELFNTPENLDVTRTENTIFGLSQRFPFPGKLSLRESIAVKEADMAASLLRAKEREVASQVKSAYYEVFLAHKAIDVHHRQVEFLQEFFEIANGRFRAGKGAQVDVLKSAVERSKLENELPVLEQQRETAKAKLNLLLSRAPQSPLGEPAEPIGPAEPGQRPALEDLQQIAVQSRPELRAVDLEIARSRTATALAQKQYYPDFNVMGERYQNFGARDGVRAMVTMTLP